MKVMSCDEVIGLAPELALDIACGAERAAALAHLDTCGSCQQVVSSLTNVSDQLLLFLTPIVEPPPGFERQVLELAGEAAVPVRPRRMWLAAVAAVAALVAILAFAFGLAPSGSRSVVTAPMRTSTGAVVGTASVQRQPAVLSMSLPDWQLPSGYRQPADGPLVRIEHSGGPAQLVSFTMNPAASWATALDVDPRTITDVALVDRAGHVWCEARFSRS